MNALVAIPSSHAGWLFYHKPEFKGKVVDAETNKPIEGVVVVVSYTKTTTWLGAGANSSVIDVRETKTDNEGNFVIPSYTALIQPFSWESSADFLIYMPGYANTSYLGLEDAFSTKNRKSYEVPWLRNMTLKFIVSPGVVALPKLRTREERQKAIPGHITEVKDKTPLLDRMIDEEDKALDLK
jgi:hypothetical protein